MFQNFCESYLGLYLLAIGSLTIVLLWTVNRIFRRMERKSAEYVDALKTVQSVATRSPMRRPIERFKAKASVSISHRYSIIRGVISGTVVGLGSLAFVFPFLDKLPKTFVSIFVTGGAFIISIAARPFVENLISGMVISGSQHINIGDTVRFDNNYGTVEDISPTHTIIRLWDWRRYVIPNSISLQKEFLNYSLYDSWVWSYVEFWVSYDEEFATIKQIAIQAAQESPHFSKREAPKVWIMDATPESYKCWLVAWAKTALDAWHLAIDVRTTIVNEFQQRGIKGHLRHFQTHPTPSSGDPFSAAGSGDSGADAFTPDPDHDEAASAPPPHPAS